MNIVKIEIFKKLTYVKFQLESNEVDELSKKIE